MNTQARSKLQLPTAAFRPNSFPRPRTRWPGNWTGALACALFLATVVIAAAQAPSAINYQGKLSNSDGSPVATGYYTVWFRIWSSLNDTSSSGYIWGRSFPINVSTGGAFNVLLDDNGSLVNDPSIPRYTNILEAFQAPNRYLGLSIAAVNGTSVTPVKEISPRQQLVSAPYAIHASTAASANSSDTSSLASQAALATYATTAGNATNFGNLTTNDFIRAKAPNQVLTGNLSVTDWLYTTNLTVQTQTTMKGPAFANDTFTASRDVYVTGALRPTGGIVGSGAVTWAGASPIMIRQFTVANIPHTATTTVLYDTGQSTNDWSAVIAGFRFDGNVADSNIRKPLWEVRMVSHLQRWYIAFFVYPEDDLTNIKVDVMFIRREFVSDNRTAQ